MEQLGPEGLGCAIPGRWRRSLQDVERALDLGVRVRVVKGQWADPDEPDMDQREGFLDIIDRLAGRCRKVGVATHDPPLAREAFRRLKTAGTPCEHELLFGLPIEPAYREGLDLGVPARLCIPYGEAWFPYSVSRALEKPTVFWWLLRDLLRGSFFHIHPTALNRV
ncbi:hypothetical protein ACFL3S_08355 [Gemmatimonadota bacterium]